MIISSISCNLFHVISQRLHDELQLIHMLRARRHEHVTAGECQLFCYHCRKVFAYVTGKNVSSEKSSQKTNDPAVTLYIRELQFVG